MDAVAQGVVMQPPEPMARYVAFVDMSGGSSDDATLAIAHRDAEEHGVLDVVVHQGQRPPFDPRMAIERFAAVLSEYNIVAVTGDRYAGETFRCDFAGHGIRYAVAEKPKSALYESLEPLLNGRRVMLLDVPVLEQQLLGRRGRAARSITRLASTTTTPTLPPEPSSRHWRSDRCVTRL